MRRFLLGFLVVLVIASVAFAGDIKVGVVLPLTGDGQEDGVWSQQAMEVANEMFPSVGGQTIKLIFKDDKTDPKVSKQDAEELVKEGVVAIIGWPWSGLALGGTPVAESAKIPAICTWATNPKVTAGKKYVSRIAFTDDFQGLIGAKFLHDTLHAKIVIAVQDAKQPYSVGLVGFFVKAFKQLGGIVVKTISVKTGDSYDTMMKVAKEIAQVNPNAVYAPLYPNELAKLVKALRKGVGYKGIIMLGDTGGTPTLPKLSDDTINGVYFTDHYHIKGVNSKIGKEFLKAFKEKFNKDATYAAAAVAFDAYYVLYNAMKRVVAAGKKLTPENINYEVRHTKNLSCVTGTITINPKTGNPTKPIFIVRWENNQVKFLKMLK